MATRTEVRLIDDLDGESAAAETVSFGISGTSYEIDLTAENAKEMRSAFDKYVAAARKVSRSGKPNTRLQPDVDPAAVRAWASGNGITVNARGRLSKDLVEQFRAAGN